MIGLDTNILLRYFTQDDEKQSEIANFYIEEQCSEENQAFINSIVFCELVWVLEVAYKYEKTQIADVLEKILQTSQFVVEDTGAAWNALSSYKKSKADFSDALLAEINKNAGCKKTFTFDKRASKLPEFELLT